MSKPILICMLSAFASLPAFAQGGPAPQPSVDVPVAPPLVVVPPTPEEDGTSRKLLTGERRETLREFADTSKAALELALRRADGEKDPRRVEIMGRAIRDVVIRSYKLHTQAELLMRMSLKQGLDLTLGIPLPDGTVRPGVLSGSDNCALFAKILEGSIKLAIRYYEDDRKAIQAGTTLELPINLFAAERLKLARDEWMPLLTDQWGLEYDFEVALLYQWLNTANSSQNLVGLDISNELTQTNDLLESLPPPPQRPVDAGYEDLLAPIVRGKLREHIKWLSHSLETKLAASK